MEPQYALKHSETEIFVFIREWCESKGLIQARVVDHIDVDKSTVSHWWKNETRPDPPQVLAIAKMLGIDPRWLHYDPREVGPRDMELMETWWSLDPSQKQKAKAVLSAYFSVGSEETRADRPSGPLPDDIAHLSRMKMALDEQSQAIANVIVARLAGKPDPKAGLSDKIISATREATKTTSIRRPKSH
jgi:transcriptional regulator with XRE-family HTH domain